MGGDVSLQEITAQTVRAVTDLRVAAGQESYVASNAVSIAQAYFHPEAWFRAIYREDELCGFVMLRDNRRLPLATESPEVFLWRFMIDQRYQRTGLGRKALTAVIDHVRTTSSIDTIYTSYVAGPLSPLSFYSSFGFTPTGETKANGEIGLKYRVRR